MIAKGTFEVALAPMEFHVEGQGGVQLGRMAIEKSFDGDLQASSQGEMLSARTPVPGSAGYVALEQVSGSLGGRAGGFVLQHFGVMDGGKDRLVLEVVPGSGTEGLVGLSGTMIIRIEDGRHLYEFDYSQE